MEVIPGDMVGSSSATATHPGSLRNAPRLLSQLLSTIVAAAGAMDAFTIFDSPDSREVAVVLSLQLTQLVCSTRRNDASFGPCVIRRPKRQLAGCSSLVQTEPRARADREEPRALFVARVDVELYELVEGLRIVRRLSELGQPKNAAQLVRNVRFPIWGPDKHWQALDVLHGVSESHVAEARCCPAKYLKAPAPKRDMLLRARIQNNRGLAEAHATHVAIVA